MHDIFWWTKTCRNRSKMNLKNSLIKIEKPTVEWAFLYFNKNLLKQNN